MKKFDVCVVLCTNFFKLELIKYTYEIVIYLYIGIIFVILMYFSESHGCNSLLGGFEYTHCLSKFDESVKNFVIIVFNFLIS